MNAKIRMIGLLFAVVVVVAAIGLSELRGQDAAADAITGRNASVLYRPWSLFDETRGVAQADAAGRPRNPFFQQITQQKTPYIQQITQQIKNHSHYLSDPNKSDEEKAKAKQELEVLLNQYFDEDIKARQAKITEIEQRVAKLKAQIEKRRAAKSELVQLQMKLIENEAAGLGFFGTGEASRSGFDPEGVFRDVANPLNR